MASDLRECTSGAAFARAGGALRCGDFVGILVSRRGFGPAWCVGRAGEDGTAAGKGCGAGELLATQMTWSVRLRFLPGRDWAGRPAVGAVPLQCRRAP